MTSTVSLIIDGLDVVDTEATVFAPNPGSFTSSTWQVQGATTEHCLRAVESAARAWVHWRKTTADEKAELFTKLAAVLMAGKKELAGIMEEEVSTSKFWAGAMTEDAVDLASNTAHLVGAGSLTTGVSPAVRNEGALAIVSQRPLGVVLGIAPWNAPAILGLRAVAAAVAAGNCCIFKGSEFSPRTHYFVAKAFRDAGFPPGVVNFLVHRPEDAPSVFETLISHPAVRKCNFTGSTGVGRHIASRAAHFLKPVLLELGGKNFALVLDDADLENAAEKILFGALLNVRAAAKHYLPPSRLNPNLSPPATDMNETLALQNGQICMSTDIVLVSPKNKAALCQHLAEKLSVSASQHVKHVINDRSSTRINALVDDAVQKGSTLIRFHGTSSLGKAIVIQDLGKNMNFWEQESFGPVVGVATYDSLESAVAMVNEGEYGLSAAIFTRAGLAAVHVASQLNVGAVHINGPTVHDEVGLPHGGHKNSGWGRFGGSWGLQEFVHTQTVILNP